MPFALGALFTLVITAVNHRRDHIKHVRETVSEAIKDISDKGVAFWAASYSVDNMVKMRGAVVYMQHILPYAVESTYLSAETSSQLEQKFREITHAALFVENDLNESSHKIDPDRVTKLLVLCAAAEAQSNNTFLQKMSLWSLVGTTIKIYSRKLVSGFKKFYDMACVP